MADLISRAAAIAELMQMVKAHEHEIFRGELLHYTGIKAMLEAQPAVDAIPVEWMREKMRGYASSLKSTEMDAVVRVMQMWQKEQEAR